MLINTNNDTTQTSANFKAENMNIKIDGRSFSLILDKLYTNPHEAVVRELCTNAVDSHKLANNPNPFHIQLPSRFDNNFIIRDFGTGLDDKEINKYLNTLFESNKDKDNNFAGGFGLGSKSPFAIVPSFHIESYKNGKVYQCFWYKDESGQPVLSIVSITDTIESNGVKFTIPVKANEAELINRAALTQLFAFDLKPEFYSDITKPATKYEFFKDTSIIFTKKYKKLEVYTLGSNMDYSVRQRFSSVFVRIGPVTYPVNNSVLNSISSVLNTLKNFININNSGGKQTVLVIDVPIGSVEIPMSREFILDNVANNKVLSDTIKKALEDTIEEVCETFYSIIKINPKNNSVTLKNYLEALKAHFDENKLPYNNESYSPLNSGVVVDYQAETEASLKHLKFISKPLPSGQTAPANNPNNYEYGICNTLEIPYQNRLSLLSLVTFYVPQLKLINNINYKDHYCKLFNCRYIYADASGNITLDRSRYGNPSTIFNYSNIVNKKDKRLIVLQDTLIYNSQRMQAYITANPNYTSIIKVELTKSVYYEDNNTFDPLVAYYNDVKDYLDLDYDFVYTSALPKVVKASNVLVNPKNPLSYYAGIRYTQNSEDLYQDIRYMYNQLTDLSNKILKSYDSKNKLEPISLKHFNFKGSKVLVLNNIDIKRLNTKLVRYEGITDYIICSANVYNNIVNIIKSDSKLSLYTSDDIDKVVVDITSINKASLIAYSETVNFYEGLRKEYLSYYDESHGAFLLSLFTKIDKNYKFYNEFKYFIDTINTLKSSMNSYVFSQLNSRMFENTNSSSKIIDNKDYIILHSMDEKARSLFLQNLKTPIVKQFTKKDLEDLFNLIDKDIYVKHHDYLLHHVPRPIYKEITLRLIK